MVCHISAIKKRDKEQRLAHFEDVEAHEEKEVAEIGRPHVTPK